MTRLLASAAACSLAILCTACAGGPVASSDASGITMYGTLDEGIVIRH
ncbi:hypothetical protein [Paraburkholderia sp.]|nr:hypothetical protein [Paraburkholderia sp.]